MVKKKQPCTHFYCFIVSIIAALFKFYTKSVKIIDKIFFSYYFSRIIRGLPKNLSAGATYKNSCCCSQGGFNDPFVELYLRLLLPFLVVTSTLFFVFRSLSFFYTLLRLFFFFQIMGRVHLSFSLAPTLFYGICGVTENNFFR